MLHATVNPKVKRPLIRSLIAKKWTNIKVQFPIKIKSPSSFYIDESLAYTTHISV